jgi:hypothetical protein
MQTFSDTLVQVFRVIAANKLRSFLTMFGIAWGVGSLLVLSETITINEISFTVIGRVEPISHGNNERENQKLYIPQSVMQELFA